MDKIKRLEPVWYDFACFFGTYLPFVGGAVSDHLAKTVSPEVYYHYHEDIKWLGLLLGSGSLLFEARFLIGMIRNPSNLLNLDKATIFGLFSLINAGYMYNAYRFEMNRTEEIDKLMYEDYVRPWVEWELRQQMQFAGENTPVGNIE